MIQKIINLIFDNTIIFNKFRNIVHNDFKKEKNIIMQEFDVKSNKKILDFGCGVGQYSVIFKPENYTGVDLDFNNINFAKKNFKGNFFLNKPNKLDFPNDKFDFIMALAMFHHINNLDLEIILKEFKRILKPKGKIFIIDLLPHKYQKNILSNILISLDRGRFIRDINDLIQIFSKFFKINKKYFIKTGPYIEYVVVLSK